jgi:coatomer protein complex subunit gamma
MINYLFKTKTVLCFSGLSTISDDVIIVTSSLTKDMTGKEDSYRAAAIRYKIL